MTIRLKIEYTPQYQAAYIRKGFGEKDRQKLIKTVQRECYKFEKFRICKGSGVPEVLAGGFAFAPLAFYEIAETGECCKEKGLPILYPQDYK